MKNATNFTTVYVIRANNGPIDYVFGDCQRIFSMREDADEALENFRRARCFGPDGDQPPSAEDIEYEIEEVDVDDLDDDDLSHAVEWEQVVQVSLEWGDAPGTIGRKIISTMDEGYVPVHLGDVEAALRDALHRHVEAARPSTDDLKDCYIVARDHRGKIVDHTDAIDTLHRAGELAYVGVYYADDTEAAHLGWAWTRESVAAQVHDLVEAWLRENGDRCICDLHVDAFDESRSYYRADLTDYADCDPDVCEYADVDDE